MSWIFVGGKGAAMAKGGKGKGFKGAWKGGGGKGLGSIVEGAGCMICGGEDHWKGECRMRGITCIHCGGEHLNRLCRWKHGKGKGEGKGEKGGDYAGGGNG